MFTKRATMKGGAIWCSIDENKSSASEPEIEITGTLLRVDKDAYNKTRAHLSIDDKERVRFETMLDGLAELAHKDKCKLVWPVSKPTDDGLAIVRPKVATVFVVIRGLGLAGEEEDNLGAYELVNSKCATRKVKAKIVLRGLVVNRRKKLAFTAISLSGISFADKGEPVQATPVSTPFSAARKPSLKRALCEVQATDDADSDKENDSSAANKRVCLVPEYSD